MILLVFSKDYNENPVNLERVRQKGISMNDLPANYQEHV
jgi:hypothetical protein